MDDNVAREAPIKRLTKRFLRYALKRTGTKLFLILGHLRSGKSSLFESLTGLSGHSKGGVDSVTKEYQIGAATINGELCLFVDTPGLNDPTISNSDILREIAKLLEITKDCVTYAGVLYVHPASLPFSDETKKSLLFLNAFCGSSYSPSITFVTTMWDSIHPDLIEDTDELVSQMARGKWSLFLQRGANLYHHGRVYEGDVPTFDTLSLKRKPEARQVFAREAISRLYPRNKNYPAPLIIQELRAGIALENTTAGKFLDMPSLQVAIASGCGNSTPRSDEQQTQPGGFDWFGAIAAAIKYPIDKVTAFLAELLDLVAILKTAISNMMPGVEFNASPVRFTGFSFEVLFTFPMGLKFVVGVGLNGPYLRRWTPQTQGEEFEDNFNFEEESTDASDMAFGTPENSKILEERLEMDEPYADPRYLAIRTTFKHILSEQGSTFRAQSVNRDSEQTGSQEMDSWWWERCALM